MNYLFLDTNIYIRCSLAWDTDDNPKMIEDLISIVDRNSIKLLMPEVIESEYLTKVEDALELLDKDLNTVQDFIYKELKPQKKECKNTKDVNALLDYIESLKKNRKNSLLSAQKLIQQLLDLKGTIRLQINPDILTKAYLRQVAHKRPFTRDKFSQRWQLPIVTDCVAFECILNFVNTQTDIDTVYICAKDKDYLDNDRQSLHEDINSCFNCNVELIELPFFLEKFGKPQSEKIISFFNTFKLPSVSEQKTWVILQETINGINESLKEYHDKMQRISDVYFWFPSDQDELKDDIGYDDNQDDDGADR